MGQDNIFDFPYNENQYRNNNDLDSRTENYYALFNHFNHPPTEEEDDINSDSIYYNVNNQNINSGKESEQNNTTYNMDENKGNIETKKLEINQDNKSRNNKKENKKNLNEENIKYQKGEEKRIINVNINNEIPTDIVDRIKTNDKNKNKDNSNLQRKRKRYDTSGKNKSNNNYLKRIRIVILDNIFEFINRVIKIKYNNKIGKSINIKQFLSINKETLSQSNVIQDKEFLDMKLKEILSKDISPKYTNFKKSKNRELLEFLINNKEKGGYFFQNLFELSFFDCLEHIRGSKDISILNGLTKMDEMLKLAKKIDEDDIENYKEFIKGYEKIRDKKPRKNKKKGINSSEKLGKDK